MDDIQDKIAQIMSDPQAMSEVQKLGRMLGLSPDSPPPEVESDGNSQNSIPPELLNKLGSLMPVLSSFNKEDDTSRLLAALRPFLGEEKRRRLDTAKRMLQILKLLPALKDGGLFDLF